MFWQQSGTKVKIATGFYQSVRVTGAPGANIANLLYFLQLESKLKRYIVPAITFY